MSHSFPSTFEIRVIETTQKLVNLVGAVAVISAERDFSRLRL